MTAEEMFNELGYVLENDSIGDTKYIIAKRKVEDYHFDRIEFNLDDKYISFGEDCVVDIEMLKAINKQCEELGWIEPTIKINKIEHYNWEE